jgi:hypothetical protein
VRLDLAGTNLDSAAFAAFYADCVHEVLPVTSGARLALVYNLVRSGETALPAPEHDTEASAAAGLLRDWLAAQKAGAAPAKMVYPLEHAYSIAELDFDTLKNVDAAVAQVLAAAAAQADCELHLALLEIAESGSAEGSYWPRRGYEDEDDGDDDGGDFEVGEVIDYDATLPGWRTIAGTVLPLGAMALLDDELCPPDAFDDIEPDESHFHEATGNEGASFDRTYRRAALVVWPRSGCLAIIGAAPVATSVPYLEHLVDQWTGAGAQPGTAAWTQACALADAMVNNWPSTYGHDGALAARFLDSLASLRHLALIDIYLDDIAVSSRFAGAEANALARAALLLAPQRTADLLGAIVAANARRVPGPCAVLVGAGAKAGAAMRTLLAPAAGRLVDALLGGTVAEKTDERWHGPAPVNGTAIVAALAALRDAAVLDQGESVVDHWLATCALDDELVNAACAVAQEPALLAYAPANRLRAQVLRQIEARIAAPLAPPPDWRRTINVCCACQYCAQLAQWLDDPLRKSWTLKAAEQHRRHVQATIQTARCDVDCVTLKEGSPHGLVCTKNQASYEALCRQRVADLALAPQLASSVEPYGRSVA